MSAISFKCPNCGGDLKFDPASQKYKCEYCISLFTQEELEAANPSEKEKRDVKEETKDREQGTEQTGEGEATLYSCPSCGAQIVTDATTAATFCYYCHNPVVLSGRLSGEYLPKKVIPFKVDKKTAVSTFMEYVNKKKFVPKAFFDKAQIEKFSGVYFPYWICDVETQGNMRATATQLRVWRMGELEYTETSYYDIERHGNLAFEDYIKNALSKANRQLVEAIQPFEYKEAQPFSMGYLSGFQAEKRDMEASEFREDTEKELKGYASKLLKDSIKGYATVQTQGENFHIVKEDWEYSLLPVWLLTYKDKNDKIFYYAMNGQTGKIFGELPIDYVKLGMFCGIIFLAVLIIGLIGGYFI